jgi:CRISP-associated protein Cas1
MIGKIVEVSGEARYLSMERGFMVVSHAGAELGRIALDDMAGLVCTAHGVSYSNNLIIALASRACPIVFCGHNYMPVAVVWPTESHHRQSGRLDRQMAMTKPMRDRLWKQIVGSKVSMQAEALGACGKNCVPLRAMVRKVRSGDLSNIEGQAARAYWPLLLGRGFRRDQDGDGINGLLNYGYAILRSTVARHLMGAGLHPGIPLHHANDGNPMRLVDDVMEPFRPVIDCLVWKLVEKGLSQVTKESKQALALMPTMSLAMLGGISPVTLVIQRLCVSLAQSLEDRKVPLALPHTSKGLLATLWDEVPTEEKIAIDPK